MSNPSTPPDAGWSVWPKLIIPAVFVGLVTLLWRIIRPGVARLIFYFLEHRDARVYFRQYVNESMPEIATSLATTTSAMRTLQGIVETSEERRELLHEQNAKVSEGFQERQDKMDTKIDRILEFMGRIEGREDIRSNNEANRSRRRGDNR